MTDLIETKMRQEPALIGVLKDDCAIFANILGNMQKSPYASHLEISQVAKRIEVLNAQIARLESEALVEAVRVEICKGLGVNPVTHSYEFIAKAAIDAVLGRV